MRSLPALLLLAALSLSAPLVQQLDAQSTGAAAAPTFNAGDKVQVKWLNLWYDARVLAVRGAEYRIRYDGYDAKWDEWVGPERIAPPGATPPDRPAAKPAVASAVKPAVASAVKPAAKPGGTAAARTAQPKSNSLPHGKWTCQVWSVGSATLDNVAEFTLNGNGTYTDHWNRGRGRYSYDAKSRRIRFTSGPQKTDQAVITFDPVGNRARRGHIVFTYESGATLDCYR